jgi:transposase
MERRGRYAGAQYAPEVKEVLGAVGHELRQRGWPLAAVKSFCSDAGYAVGRETLRQWTDASGAGRSIISNAKKTGARKKLGDEGRRAAAGWVLSQEKKVDRRRYRSFVEEEFDVSISPSSASNYLAEFDLSRRMMGSRPREKGVSFDQFAKEGYDYIVGLHNDGFFVPDHSLIWAVDFTSTAIKQQRYFTYGAKGAKQQKYTKEDHTYTDNIFTALGLDGSIIPPHAFSANPQLKPGSKMLLELCEKYDVDPATVLFCPGASNWVGETSSMVYTVVKKYDWTDCHIVHDDGNSWKPKGDDIFYEYKAARVSVMPPNPHGVLSPCDNSYHAVAKVAERASRPDGASDAEITIRTMHYLLNVKADSVRSFWRQNLMLDHEKPSLAAYVDMLKGNDKLPQKRKLFHQECVEAYKGHKARSNNGGSD